MLELLVIVAIAFLAYKLLRLSKRSAGQNQEIAAEVRYIASNEFRVPSAYINHSAINRMGRLKNAAQEAKDSESHGHLSWARLIALAIFTGFRNECIQYQKGNPVTQSLFERLQIPPDAIAEALNTDIDALHKRLTS